MSRFSWASRSRSHRSLLHSQETTRCRSRRDHPSYERTQRRRKDQKHWSLWVQRGWIETSWKGNVFLNIHTLMFRPVVGTPFVQLITFCFHSRLLQQVAHIDAIQIELSPWTPQALSNGSVWSHRCWPLLWESAILILIFVLSPTDSWIGASRMAPQSSPTV